VIIKKEKDVAVNLLQVVDDIVNVGKAVLSSQGSNI